jgi:hypothetical protein
MILLDHCEAGHLGLIVIGQSIATDQAGSKTSKTNLVEVCFFRVAANLAGSGSFSSTPAYEV